MASRRTRIKGIANIPQRKKNVAPTENPSESLTTEKPEEIAQSEVPTNKQSNGLTSSNELPNPIPVEPEKQKLTVAEPAQSNSVVIHSDVEVSKPLISTKVACDITKQISDASPSENQPVLNEHNVSNVVFRNPENLGSDTEYPGPPASPSKYNR